KENHSTVSGSPVPRGAGCDLEDLCGQVRGYRRVTGRRRVDRGGNQGMLSEGVPAEADAEGISGIPCPGIPFGGGPDQGAAATGLREVHQRVLPWRIPVPGVRTGAARGTCVSGFGELSSALHQGRWQQQQEGRERSKEVSAYGEFTTVMSEERYLVDLRNPAAGPLLGIHGHYAS